MSECKECGTELPEHPYLCHACESKDLRSRHAAAIAALHDECEALEDDLRYCDGGPLRHMELELRIANVRAVLAAEEKAR